MKIVKLEETTPFKNSDKCIATVYEHNDKDIDISTATISGRYPEKGYCVNLNVKEMIYVIKGGGKICKSNQTIEFGEGDAILIDAGEKYYWEADCFCSMSCTPAWYPEQHILTD